MLFRSASLGEAREGSRRVSNVVLELGKEEARKEGRGDSRPYLAYLLLLLASLLHTASSSLSPLLPATDPWLLLLLLALLSLLLLLQRLEPLDVLALDELELGIPTQSNHLVHLFQLHGDHRVAIHELLKPCLPQCFKVMPCLLALRSLVTLHGPRAEWPAGGAAAIVMAVFKELHVPSLAQKLKIGRASCRERV